MIKLISILVLLAGVSFGATFTDVTVTGTPYLTTNVLNELYYSFLSRGAHSDASLQTHSIATSLDPDDMFYEGLIVNTRYSWFYEYRNMAAGLWKGGWIKELPTNAVSSIPVYTNQVDYFVAAGMSSNGWRNATNYNPAVNNWRNFSDPMYIYRTNAYGFVSDVNEGDILGPWIIDDLQLAFDHARYKVDGSWRGAGNPTNTYYGGGSHANPDTAKSLAITDFAPSSGWSGIYAYGNLYYNSLYREYSAEIRNSTGFMYDFTRIVSPGDNGIRTNSTLYYFGGEIYGYAYAIKYWGNSTFDDFGYSVEEDKYTLVATLPIPQGTITNYVILREAFGDPSILPDFPTGTPTTATNSLYKGFNIIGKSVIYSINHPYSR